MSLTRGHNVPTSTRILVGMLVTTSTILYVAKFFISITDPNPPPMSFYRIVYETTVPYIQLIPKSTIFFPWVIVSAIFAEITIVSFVFSFVVLIVGSKFAEKFWGYYETVKFVLVIGSVTNLITVLIAIISNLFRSDGYSMDLPLGGGISYYFGFLVVFKQLIPEHNIVLFQGLVNFRIKHLPFALLIVLSFWSILISHSLYPAIPSIVSFLVAFNYLRFFQPLRTEPTLPISSNDSANGSILIGDASDTFQLIEFFPSVTKPYLGPVFNQVYEFSVFLGIVTPFNDERVQQSNSRAQKRQENQVNNIVASSVAERRRQVALQVIEERISKETPK